MTNAFKYTGRCLSVSVIVAFILGFALLAPHTARAAEAASDSVALPFFDYLKVDTYNGRLKDINAVGYFKMGVRTVHAPRAEWEGVPGVDRYRLILTQNRRVLGVTEATTSPQVVTNGWDKVTTGTPAGVTIQGLDKSGKLIAISRIFPCYVAPPFSKTDIAPLRRSYRDAAIKAFEALYNWELPPNAKKLVKGKAANIRPVLLTVVMLPSGGSEDDMHVSSYSNPTFNNKPQADMVESLMKIAPDELKPKLLDYARSIGDHTLMCQSPVEGYKYGGLVWSFANFEGGPNTDERWDAKEFERVGRRIEAAKNGYPAEALVIVYELTGDRKYLEGAKVMAEAFVRTQGEDGSWPARADAKTGRVMAEYSTAVAGVISFLDRLNKHIPDPRWIAARDKAMKWMMDNPMRTCAWVTNFEDVPGGTTKADPFKGNMSNYDLFPFVRYLCGKPAGAPENLAARIREQLNWCDNHFIFYGQDPLMAFDTWYPVCAEQGNPGIFDETIGCWQPMDQHTGNWGNALLSVYRLTGDPQYLEIARAAGAALTNYQLDDGRTMTWFCDRTFGNRAYYGAALGGYSFWPTGWAFAANFWAELAAME